MREFLKKDCAEWVKIFKERDIASGRMARFSDVTVDEQAWANDFVEEYRFRNGETAVLTRQPVRLNSVELTPSPLAPYPGEQTDDILRTFGYSEAEILGLHSSGVVQ